MQLINNLNKIKSIKEAELIMGGLTTTNKMPSLSLSLPAKECNKGSKLRKIKGSVCFDCYAMKGCYSWRPVQQAQYKRLKALAHPQWVDAMVYLINNKKRVIDSGVFRWHDSGDIQSLEHFENILKVVKATPHVKHWLPTKESQLIKTYKGSIPDNLIIRLSGSMIDGKEPNYNHTSTVTTNKDIATCRAFENAGKCGDCRKCWDKSVKTVSYYKH